MSCGTGTFWKRCWHVLLVSGKLATSLTWGTQVSLSFLLHVFFWVLQTLAFLNLWGYINSDLSLVCFWGCCFNCVHAETTCFKIGPRQDVHLVDDFADFLTNWAKVGHQMSVGLRIFWFVHRSDISGKTSVLNKSSGCWVKLHIDLAGFLFYVFQSYTCLSSPCSDGYFKQRSTTSMGWQSAWQSKVSTIYPLRWAVYGVQWPDAWPTK